MEIAFIAFGRPHVLGAARVIFDLHPAGTQMFLNAVNYMAGTVPGPSRPELSVAQTATGLSITSIGTLAD